MHYKLDKLWYTCNSETLQDAMLHCDTIKKYFILIDLERKAIIEERLSWRNIQ